MTAIDCDTRVLTNKGWFWASELSAGQRILCLHGDGQLRMTRISSVTAPLEQQTVSLFTEVGDIEVPAREPVLTANGPVEAAELVAMSDRGVVKVEVVQPNSIATFAQPRKKNTEHKAAVLAMSWLDRHWTAVPATLSGDRLHSLANTITQSQLPAKVSADDRWFSWSWTPVECTDRRARPASETMLSLTAWGDEHSRTTLPDRRTRAAVLMAVCLDGLQVKLTWTPGYAPVECRIGVQRTSMPYAKVAAARLSTSQVVRLGLERVGAVVTSQLAVGRLG
jgi:hypothetical protein